MKAPDKNWRLWIDESPHLFGFKPEDVIMLWKPGKYVRKLRYKAIPSSFDTQDVWWRPHQEDKVVNTKTADDSDGMPDAAAMKRVWEAAKEWYQTRRYDYTPLSKTEKTLAVAVVNTLSVETNTEESAAPAKTAYQTLLEDMESQDAKVICRCRGSYSDVFQFTVPPEFAAAVLVDMGYVGLESMGEYDIPPRGLTAGCDKLREVDADHPFLQLTCDYERFHYLLEI
jgi:hypothetical protein